MSEKSHISSSIFKTWKYKASHLAQEAMEALRSILTDPDAPHNTKLNAANSILDRLLGKVDKGDGTKVVQSSVDLKQKSLQEIVEMLENENNK